MITDLMHANLLEVFNQRDRALRREAIGRIYADDIRWTDDDGVTMGRAALDAKAVELQAKLGDLQFIASSAACTRIDDGGPNTHRAKLNPPTRIIATPAILPLTSPNGSVFSSRMKMAIAAIHRRFMTPPTKSNPIRIQQQPTQ